jgi:hypothetical protein
MSNDKPRNSSSTSFYDEDDERQLSPEVKGELEKQLGKDLEPKPTSFVKISTVLDRTPQPGKSSNWIYDLHPNYEKISRYEGIRLPLVGPLIKFFFELIIKLQSFGQPEETPTKRPSGQAEENNVYSSPKNPEEKVMEEEFTIDEIAYYKRMREIVESAKTISLDQFDDFAYQFEKAKNRGELDTLEKQQAFIRNLQNQMDIVKKTGDHPSPKEIDELRRISMELGKRGKGRSKSIAEASFYEG